MKTYSDIYLNARRKLRAAGIEAHDLEARLIVCFASGKTREDYVASNRFYVTDAEVERSVDSLIERRLKGEPVAYLVKEWEFYGLSIMVDESVLIPRIDSELAAEISIKLLKRKGWQTRLLDLCAGSGCIGLAISAHVPTCRVVLADISEQALAICRRNMIKNGLSRHVTAIEVDATERPPALLGRFDVIVSNPPYIPTQDIQKLDPSVRDYEPHSALDGGLDGFDFIRAIADYWKPVLKPEGNLVLECGIGQVDEVCEIMYDAGYKDVKMHTDTGGVERVVVGTLK
ncbi:MAG: peptide chain release factor N(5)-glutamine methyltransferase [Oscillospiraceae bacterium]|nr:peptide chain release factor N(5)-glutamine methyltransferase [Oscillospiraceae bacterium]